MKKKIAILGSTGSIGTQTLEVIALHKDKYEIVALTAHSSIELLLKQAREFEPKYIGIVNKEKAVEFKKEYDGSAIVLDGTMCLEEIASLDDIDIVLNSVVGSAGLLATMATLNAGNDLALANKESLVVGGSLVIETAKKK